MRASHCLFYFLLTGFAATSQPAPGDNSYKVPDSVRASGIYLEVRINKNETPRNAVVKLGVDETSLLFQEVKGRKSVIFQGTRYEKPFVKPPGVASKRNRFTWDYAWQYDQRYIFLVMRAVDTAMARSMYSAYIFLPGENKWKHIGTFANSQLHWLTSIATEQRPDPAYQAQFSNRWLLRSDNSWKPLDGQTTRPPVLRPMSNIDSVVQQELDEKALRSKLSGDKVTYKDGIFYQVLQEGNGRQVQLTDTVTVHYKGWLFSNNQVFDETKEKPAVFPLARLIKGWQIGVPQCKVGGKVRLYIPSGSAYGFRTFAMDIPPNSTLVFDVEVVDAKEK